MTEKLTPEELRSLAKICQEQHYAGKRGLHWPFWENVPRLLSEHSEQAAVIEHVRCISAQMKHYAAKAWHVALDAAISPCPVPPPGWECSRTSGHDGPCAASPAPGQALPARGHCAEHAGWRSDCEACIAPVQPSETFRPDRHLKFPTPSKSVVLSVPWNAQSRVCDLESKLQDSADQLIAQDRQIAEAKDMRTHLESEIRAHRQAHRETSADFDALKSQVDKAVRIIKARGPAVVERALEVLRGSR